MSNNNNKRKILLLCITSLLIGVMLFHSQDMLKLPKSLKIFEDEKQLLDIEFPFNIDTEKLDSTIVELFEKDKKVSINPLKIGKTNIQVQLLGLLPVYNVEVDVVPKIKLIPSGQSIGVKVNTKGVLVVGLEEIKGIDGKKHNPAREAGLNVGDSLIEINHTKVIDADHVTQLINENKKETILLKIERREKIFEVSLKPVKSLEQKDYKIGLWVRDKTAGIGTLTFCDPKTIKFGALGHAITDVDTGLLLPIDNGEIIKSKVASIQPGKKGRPGEIKGIFYDTTHPMGNVQKNTNFGIYGEIHDISNNSKYCKPIQVAYQNQVREGKATILTTIDDNQIKPYEVYIEKVNRQRIPNTKSMIIRVTDKELLKKTGGIVQGMSGSPIIQDGKLIGAVTHVFVNDPTKGYGLFIEWMIKEAEIGFCPKNKIAENVA